MRTLPPSASTLSISAYCVAATAGAPLPKLSKPSLVLEVMHTAKTS